MNLDYLRLVDQLLQLCNRQSIQPSQFGLGQARCRGLVVVVVVVVVSVVTLVLSTDHGGRSGG
jgi:hypothetical protein